MWARWSEVLLADWLLAAPFVFGQADPGDPARILDDPARARELAAAAAVALLALASLWRPLRHAHVLTLPIAVWIAAAGWLAAPHPRPPAAQNLILTGLLLLMFAAVPSDAFRPPVPWRSRAVPNRAPPSVRSS